MGQYILYNICESGILCIRLVTYPPERIVIGCEMKTYYWEIYIHFTTRVIPIYVYHATFRFFFIYFVLHIYSTFVSCSGSRWVSVVDAVFAISEQHLHYITLLYIGTIYTITICTTTFPHERFFSSLYNIAIYIYIYVCALIHLSDADDFPPQLATQPPFITIHPVF